MCLSSVSIFFSIFFRSHEKTFTWNGLVLSKKSAQSIIKKKSNKNEIFLEHIWNVLSTKTETTEKKIEASNKLVSVRLI